MRGLKLIRFYKKRLQLLTNPRAESRTMDTNLNIEDIIKVLPFDVTYKADLLKIWPTLDLERSTAIEVIIRELYESVFSLHYQRNVQLAIDKLPPETNVDDNFYKAIKEQTRLEMEKAQHSVVGNPQATITNVRDQLQQVISEKQVAN